VLLLKREATFLLFLEEGWENLCLLGGIYSRIRFRRRGYWIGQAILLRFPSAHNCSPSILLLHKRKAAPEMLVRQWQLVVVMLLGEGLLSGCMRSVPPPPLPVVAGGSVDRGREVIVQYRCGSCHRIPGIRNAKGVFGPPLNLIARQTTLAGNFPNVPSSMVQWIKSPTSMKPKTAMPDLGLSEQQARDAAAYLYTLHK
jgi:cytochrome c